MIDYYSKAIEYYNNKEIVELILPYLYNRESAFKKIYVDENPYYNMLKYKRIQNINDFQWNFIKTLNQFKRQYNLYHSLATFKEGLPIITFAGMTKEKMKENKDNWKNIHQTKITAFDFLLDFDCPNYKLLNYCAVDVLRVIKHLKIKYNCNPRVTFSGRGFQVIIPYTYMKDCHHLPFIEKEEQENIYKKYKSIAKELHEKYTELIDLAGYDSMKICKVPYSLVVNTDKSKDIYIAKLMSEEDLKKFNIKMVQYNE